jgi:hypothetical protein
VFALELESELEFFLPCVFGVLSAAVHGPMWPPPLITAATACWSTVIVTAGCVFDPVRWQTTTLRPLGVVLVVVVVTVVVAGAVVVAPVVSRFSSGAPLAMLATAKPAAASTAVPRTTSGVRRFTGNPPDS